MHSKKNNWAYLRKRSLPIPSDVDVFDFKIPCFHDIDFIKRFNFQVQEQKYGGLHLRFVKAPDFNKTRVLKTVKLKHVFFSFTVITKSSPLSQ